MADSLELGGIMYRKMEKQQITEKLTKRDFVIETTDDQYPQLVKFELINDKCEIIDNIQNGTKVKVKFNVTGREWKKDDGSAVFFVALKAWRVEPIDGSAAVRTAQTSAPVQQQQSTPAGGGIDDDLPF